MPPSNPSTLMDETSLCCGKTKPKRLSFGCIKTQKVKMRHRKNLLKAALLSSLLMFLSGGRIHAADKNSQLVHVTIGTILVNNQRDEFDAKCKSIEKQLKVLKYRSYRCLKDESQDVAWQGNGVFEISGGRSLSVVPQELRNNRISLKVRLTEGQKPLVDTIVRIPNRGNFILGGISGGPPNEGGALVLSISASAQ
jgi:hypothetical protein